MRPVNPVVEALVSRAVAAQRVVESWRTIGYDGLLRALSNTVADHARAFAVATVEETGIGNVRDKTIKNAVASLGIYAQLAGQRGHGQISFDSERQIAEIASPVGVVVGLVPATHPVATFIFKVLVALKGRNAIILKPPSAGATGVAGGLGGLIQQVLRDEGAPVDLVQWTSVGSSRQTSAALIGHRGCRRARTRNRRTGDGRRRVSVRQAGDRCRAGKCTGPHQR